MATREKALANKETALATEMKFRYEECLKRTMRGQSVSPYVAPTASEIAAAPPSLVYYSDAPPELAEVAARRDALARVMAAQEEQRRRAYQLSTGASSPPPQSVYTDQPTMSMQPFSSGLPSLDSKTTWGIVLGVGAFGLLLLVARR
jgi:hypothetical protein